MTQQTRDTESIVQSICASHAEREGPLLPILHDIQAHIGYVPDDAIQMVADQLNITRADVFGVVTFYHDFQRQPPNQHTLRVCRAEACQSAGGRALWETANRAVAGGAGQVNLEPVYCLGNCACAPAVQFDGRTLGRMDTEQVAALCRGHTNAVEVLS